MMTPGFLLQGTSQLSSKHQMRVDFQSLPLDRPEMIIIRSSLACLLAVYHITWLPSRTTKETCVSCSCSLSLEDNFYGFFVTSSPNFAKKFSMIHHALEATGISHGTFRNACLKGNKTVTRRQRTMGPLKQMKRVFYVSWNPWCRSCVGARKS